ncbi:MAG: sensor histidine kinase [Gammaproteobacteria bacterium]
MSGSNDELFLPDFCAIRAVFGIVVIAQLLAFVLVLGGAGGSGDIWADLSLVSLFIQWVALSSAVLLCYLRRWLRPLGNRYAALLSYALLLAVTWLLSEAAYRLLALYGSYLVNEGVHWEFLARNMAISAIVSALMLRYFYVQYQWKRNLEAETEARFTALQARIRPHFLFNSMNTIASLTRSDPALAEQVVEDLADLFRVTLSDDRKLVSLEDELNHAKRYLNIERLRLGDRLVVNWETGGLPATLQLPALTLQPLLENAIYHGIEPLAGGGTIDVHGEIEGREAVLEITNPRPGGGTSARQGTRTALDNVRQRLMAAFGGDRVEVEETEATYRVRLHLPLEEGR